MSSEFYQSEQRDQSAATAGLVNIIIVMTSRDSHQLGSRENSLIASMFLSAEKQFKISKL